MNLKASILTYLFLSILGVCIVFLLLKGGCVGKSSEDKLQDSLNVERRLNDSIRIAGLQAANKFDSVTIKNTQDSLSYTHLIDSQKRVIAVLTSRFNITKDSIGVLYKNLKTFYLEHDTIALVETYNRLNDQLTTANQMLFQVQLARDSADNIRDAEIVRLRGVITQLQSDISTLNTLLSQATDNASVMAKQFQQRINKVKRQKLISKVTAGIAIVLAAIVIL